MHAGDRFRLPSERHAIDQLPTRLMAALFAIASFPFVSEPLSSFGPMGWLLDRLMMKRKLTTTLDEVFASLVRHAGGQ